MTPLDQPPFFSTGSCLSRRQVIAASMGALGALACPRISLAANFEWKIVSINERDYVTFKDVQTFYRFQRFEKDGRHLWLRSSTLLMKAAIESDELFLNNVKFCLSYPVLERGGDYLISRMDLAKLVDPVLRPSYIANPSIFDTVVIDPGHGGQDSGARGVLGWEKDYTLDLGLRLKKVLSKVGLKSKMTRDSDVFITRDGRYRIANTTPNSIFVSLHFNSNVRTASGVETYALSPSGTASTDQPNRTSDGRLLSGNSSDSENIALATAVHAMVLFKLKTIDRGIRRARWTVLTGLQRAGILFEGGFVTNPDECAKINTGLYRDQLAESIAGGIMNYRKALSKRPGATAPPSGTAGQ